jgi:hypothetical protein
MSKDDVKRDETGYRLAVEGTCSVCIEAEVLPNGQRFCNRMDLDVADNGTCDGFVRAKYLTDALPSPEERERQRQKVAAAARRGAEGVQG